MGISSEQPLTKSISRSGTSSVFLVNLYASRMIQNTGMGKYVVIKADVLKPPTVERNETVSTLFSAK